MTAFFIEFEVVREDRYPPLVGVVEALRLAKQEDVWPDDDFWLTLFDAEARSYFWWPTAADLAAYPHRWGATPASERPYDPTLETPWDFGSMIDAFRNGEYEILGCRRSSPTTARLDFDPYAGPFGGTECMRALVEAFGHRVLHDSWG